MEDFQRKTHLVASCHMVHTPQMTTFSSVVTRETLVLLHDLEVKAGDVYNAYVMAPNCEMIWIVLSSEFEDNADESAIIVRTLYGLQSAGV